MKTKSDYIYGVDARYFAHFIETETANDTITITFPDDPLTAIKCVTPNEQQALMPVKV